MTPVDVKELNLRNRALHERRIRHLKMSVANRRYRVDSSLVAGGIIREVRDAKAARL